MDFSFWGQLVQNLETLKRLEFHQQQHSVWCQCWDFMRWFLNKVTQVHYSPPALIAHRITDRKSRNLKNWNNYIFFVFVFPVQRWYDLWWTDDTRPGWDGPFWPEPRLQVLSILCLSLCLSLLPVTPAAVQSHLTVKYVLLMKQILMKFFLTWLMQKI